MAGWTGAALLLLALLGWWAGYVLGYARGHREGYARRDRLTRGADAPSWPEGE